MWICVTPAHRMIVAETMGSARDMRLPVWARYGYTTSLRARSIDLGACGPRDNRGYKNGIQEFHVAQDQRVALKIPYADARRY
jgi:hypothetical protein